MKASLNSKQSGVFRRTAPAQAAGLTSRFAVATGLLLLLPAISPAATITLGPATTISADTDVVTAGTFVYAAAGNNAASTTVNTVTFTGYNAISPWGSVTLAGTGLGFTDSAYDDGGGAPFSGLSANYQAIMRGGTYDGAGDNMTVTLGGLTSGRVYAAQLWVNDTRSCCATRDETATSSGGNTVTLDYNSTNAQGGVGQYAIGVFAANATSQALTLNGNASTQLNAVQVRDVTNVGYWTGISGAAWDAASTSNFASNHASAALVNTTFDVAKAPLNSVAFTDEYYNSNVSTAVTQASVTVAAGGVSAGSVLFRNSVVNYSLTNASGTTGITGATLLSKEGAGTVTLNSANSYSRGTFINGGTLTAANAAALGTGDVVNNGTLNLTAGPVTYSALSGSMSGTGIVNLSNMGTGSSSTALNGNYSGFTGTWNIGVGAGAGAGKVQMTGLDNAAATINVLSNATVYASGGTHNASIVLNGGDTGESLGQLRVESATWSGPVTLAGAITGAGDAMVGTHSGTGTISGPIGESGGSKALSKGGAATLILTGTNTYSGATSILSGTLQIGNNTATGDLGSSTTVSNNGALVFYRSNVFSTAAVISGGGTVQKNGASTTTLSGANTYTGATTVSQGTLVLSNQGASNSSSYSITGGATLELSVTSGTRTMASNSTISGAGTFKKTGSGTLVWGGAVGTFALGSGALIDIQGGTLVGGSSANEVWTNNKADLNVATGAVFDAVEATSIANGGVFVDALTGDGIIKVGYGGGYADKITFGIDNGSGTFNGSLQNSVAAGSFVKAGSGTQTLAGSNSYTGTTTVNDGTLLVNGTHTGGGLYTVGIGSGTDTLGGSGTIHANVNILASGGVLAPGTSPGILTVNGNVSIAGTLSSELAGVTVGTNYDQLRLGTSGGPYNVTLGGTLTPLFSGSGWATPTTMLWIVNNQTAGNLINTFSNYPTNGQIVTTYASQTWRIWYGADFASLSTSGGNDVVLTPVPEPGTFAMALFGIIGIWMMGQHRSRPVRERVVR